MDQVGGAQLTYEDNATNPNTTYFYQVTGVNGAGLEGVPSNEVDVLIGDEAPAPPSALSAAGGDQEIALDWDDNSEVDLAGYHVYRAQETGGPYTLITPTPVLQSSYTDVNLTNGETYFYVVTALDAGNDESGLSSETSATPSAVDPSLVGYWGFDEGTGQIVNDSSASSNHGIRGTSASLDPADPTWTTGKLGSALDFDGIDDQVLVSNPSNVSFASGSSFTFAAWVNLPACQSKGSKIVEKKQKGSE